MSIPSYDSLYPFRVGMVVCDQCTEICGVPIAANFNCHSILYTASKIVLLRTNCDNNGKDSLKTAAINAVSHLRTLTQLKRTRETGTKREERKYWE